MNNQTKIIPLKVLKTIITPQTPAQIGNQLMWWKGGNWNGGTNPDGYYDYSLDQIYSSPGWNYGIMSPASVYNVINGHDIFTNSGTNYITCPTINGVYIFNTIQNSVGNTFMFIIKSSGDNSGGVFGSYVKNSDSTIDYTNSCEITFLGGIFTLKIGANTSVQTITFTAPLIASQFQIIFVDVWSQNLTKGINVFYNGQIYSGANFNLTFGQLNPLNSGDGNQVYGNTKLQSNVNNYGVPPSNFNIADVVYWGAMALTRDQKNQVGQYFSNRYNIPFYVY